MSLWRTYSRLNTYVRSLNVNNLWCNKVESNRISSTNFQLFSACQNEIHTSSTRSDLMEFFDSKENWSADEVRVGRAWKLDELRIKSNSDLHKLWYVLLKERNMLLTMEHEYNRLEKGLPSPERRDKVEESMENLETVVRERNRAYFELETGENGERPTGTATNCFGLKYVYRKSEFFIPKKYNKKFLNDQKLSNHTTDHQFVSDFLVKLEEKKRKRSNYIKRQKYLEACKLLEIFPNLDEEALKEKFPDIDIEKVKRDKRSRSHQENEC